MDRYAKGMTILEEKFGNNKDNVLGLATVVLEPNIKTLQHMLFDCTKKEMATVIKKMLLIFCIISK